jgi:hypothetical protein
MRLHDALSLIVDWAKARLEGVDARTMTLSQIHAYQSLTLNEPTS